MNFGNNEGHGNNMPFVRFPNCFIMGPTGPTGPAGSGAGRMENVQK